MIGVIFLVLYLCLTTKLAFHLHNKYYYVFNQAIDSNGKNIHNDYPEFVNHSGTIFSLNRLIFGLPIAIIRIVLAICLVPIFYVIIKLIYIGVDLNDKKPIHPIRLKLKNYLISIIPTLMLFTLGVIGKTVEFEEKDKKIYEKYLGKNYQEPNNHSIIIGNHISWAEILYKMRYGGGFIAKSSMESVPIIGVIIKMIDGLFIDRRDKNSRDTLLDKIKERQLAFLRGEKKTALLIYPEGTISSGEYLLPFKKGAFNSLLPVKPYITKSIFGKYFDIGPNIISAFDHMLMTACYLYTIFEHKALPTIAYTDYCKKNFKSKEDEPDYETFMNVCYKIVLEVGNFKSTNKGLNELEEYSKKILEFKKNN